MFKIKDVKFSFNGLAKWVGFFGGLLALFQGAMSLKPPTHDLSIQVPALEIFDSNIRLSIALHNTGDYNEIITNIGLYFVEDLGVKGKENNIEVAELQKMILSDSKRSVDEILEAKVDLNMSPFNLLLESGKHYSIVTRFSLVSETGDFITETLPLGSMDFVRDAKNGSYQGDLQLISVQKKVDFGKAKSSIVLTNLPRTTKFDLPKLEIVN